MKIIAFDPGNSSGWVYEGMDQVTHGGTIVENFAEIEGLVTKYEPDAIIYETFKLFPSVSKSLAWNSFYPVEVIGIIKYLCQKYKITIVGQDPSIKKFAGVVNFKNIVGTGITGHTKDAYLHLAYYKRNKK